MYSPTTLRLTLLTSIPDSLSHPKKCANPVAYERRVYPERPQVIMKAKNSLISTAGKPSGPRTSNASQLPDVLSTLYVGMPDIIAARAAVCEWRFVGG
jgi:hypothetical protein